MPTGSRRGAQVKARAGGLGTARCAALLPCAALSSCAALVLCAALLLCAALTGCGTYATTAVELRGKVDAGDLGGAITLLEKRGGKNPDVLNLLERGLLLHYDARYDSSNALLQRAEVKIDDLYTKSISRGVAAFLTNDGNLAYSGFPHEQLLLHVYGALNYLAQERIDDALVECRRVSNRMQRLESSRAQKRGYTDDAFVEWLAAMLYAQDNDANATMVSLRRARSAYDAYGQTWGIPAPPLLEADYVRWGRRFGFADEVAAQADSLSDLAGPASDLEPGEGELLLVYESGFVAHLEEMRLDFPIFKSDAGRSGDDFYQSVAGRGPRGALRQPVDEVQLAYWLSVAMPRMVHTPSRFAGARLSVGQESAPAELAEDVSAIAQLTFEEGQGVRLIRTIARGLAKYIITDQANQKSDVAGLIANIFGSATERADTRSWSSLPDRIHVARMRLPEGSHTAVVEVLDTTGNVAQTATFQRVDILAGKLTVITHRTFD